MSRLRIWPGLVALLLTAVAALAVIGWVLTRPLPQADTVLANDLRHRVEQQWPAFDASTLGAPDVTLAVVDTDGHVLLRQHDAPTDELAATRTGASSLSLTVGGQRVGTLHLVDPRVASARVERDRAVGWGAAAAVLAVTAAGVLALVWVRRRVLAPLEGISGWATRVADSDLSAPLPLHRGRAFAALSQSFDLMRSELRASREREQASTENTRLLISQLGHDIRTPLASLQAQAELLRATETDPGRATRLDTIVAKSTQIDTLLSELFSANRAELDALPVTCAELASPDLVPLLRQADSSGRLELTDPPECLLWVDARRLQQVFDNVVTNAEKYAGTAVTTQWSMTPDALVLELADSGPGVHPDDLPTVLVRGTRGRNAGDRPGSGLGLFTAAHLMDRMGGAITVRNRTDAPDADSTGLVVELALPLA